MEFGFRQACEQNGQSQRRTDIRIKLGILLPCNVRRHRAFDLQAERVLRLLNETNDVYISETGRRSSIDAQYDVVWLQSRSFSRASGSQLKIFNYQHEWRIGLRTVDKRHYFIVSYYKWKPLAIFFYYVDELLIFSPRYVTKAIWDEQGIFICSE